MINVANDNRRSHGSVRSAGPTQESLPGWEVAIAVTAAAIAVVVVAVVVYCMCRYFRRKKTARGPLIPASYRRKKDVRHLVEKRSIEFTIPRLKMIETTPQIDEERSDYYTDEKDRAIEAASKLGDKSSHGQTPNGSIRHKTDGSTSKKRKPFQRFKSVIKLKELDMALYKMNAGEPPHNLSSIHGRGLLLFSVFFNPLNGTLVVGVLKASRLQVPQFKHLPDVRIRLSLVSHKGESDTLMYSTSVAKNSTSPVFDESFCFTITRKTLTKSSLKMAVVVYDRYSRHMELGQVRYSLQELVTHAAGEKEEALELWRDIIPDSELDSVSGELLVSLCYDSSKHLHVVTHRARNLVLPRQEDTTSTGYVFVTVMLLTHERILKRQRTTSKKRHSAPGFQKEFVFSLTPSLLDAVTVVFTVCYQDNTARTIMIGQTNVGPSLYASGSGAKLWTDMRRDAGNHVIAWQKLH